MKKLIVVAVILMFAGCVPIPVKETPPIELIMEIPGYNKDQIFTGTKAWVAKTFVSAKAVIQDDDKEAGRIIGSGRIRAAGLHVLSKLAG